MILSEDLIELWTPLLRHLDMSFVTFSEEFVAALLSKLTVEEGTKDMCGTPSTMN